MVTHSRSWLYRAPSDIATVDCQSACPILTQVLTTRRRLTWIASLGRCQIELYATNCVSEVPLFYAMRRGSRALKQLSALEPSTSTGQPPRAPASPA